MVQSCWGWRNPAQPKQDEWSGAVVDNGGRPWLRCDIPEVRSLAYPREHKYLGTLGPLLILSVLDASDALQGASPRNSIYALHTCPLTTNLPAYSWDRRILAHHGASNGPPRCCSPRGSGAHQQSCLCCESSPQGRTLDGALQTLTKPPRFCSSVVSTTRMMAPTTDSETTPWTFSEILRNGFDSTTRRPTAWM